VNEWVAGCGVAWITRDTADQAIMMELFLKVEFKPPLTQ